MKKLKPLSKITDIHAIEVAKIWLNDNSIYEKYEIELIKWKNTGFKELDGKNNIKRVIITPFDRLRPSHLKRFLNISLSPIFETHFVSAGNIEEDGQLNYLIGGIRASKIVHIYQYLSQFYIFPYLGELKK